MPRGKRKAADPAGKDSNPRTPKKRKVTTQESKEESVENSINLLSDDIVRRIFFWMDLKELALVSQVSKRFNTATDQDLWKSFVIAMFGPEIVPVSQNLSREIEKRNLPTSQPRGDRIFINWKIYLKLRLRVPEFQELWNRSPDSFPTPIPPSDITINGNKVIEGLIERFLNVIPAEISRFGQCGIMSQTDYNSERNSKVCPPFIPLTLCEYEKAVKKYTELKNKENQERVEEIFTFQNEENREYEIDEDRDVGCGFGGKPKIAIKYNQYHPQISQFNPTSDNEMDNDLTQMIKIASDERNLTAAKTLIDIYHGYRDKFSLNLVQRMLRVLLGFIRAEISDESFYAAVVELFGRLSPMLTEEDNECYIEVINRIISFRGNVIFEVKNKIYLLEQFFKLHEMVVSFVVGSSISLINLMEVSLDVARDLSAKAQYFGQTQHQFHVVKRFMTCSPRKLYRTVLYSHIEKLACKNPTNEDLCVLAVLGSHFGPQYLEKLQGTWTCISRPVNLVELHENCIEWLKGDSIRSEEQVKDMENFVVLLAASFVENKLKTLCAFNAFYFDEKKLLGAINNKKFDTKIKELNQKVKKWTSIRDLFDLDALRDC